MAPDLTLASMEPLLPPATGGLAALALDLTREAGELGGQLHPVTRRSVAELLRAANTYHSNLIEGHDSRPRDVAEALRGDYAADPTRRALQLEALAHMEVQRLVEARVAGEPDLRVTAPAFLQWLHREFYERLPVDLRFVTTRSGNERVEVIPGELRTRELEVGRHRPPQAERVPAFLERFVTVYEPTRLEPLAAIVAAAASHHRLLWIHPFTDGNGRVARLATDAYLRRIGLGGHGLWTAARGLARRQRDYLAHLEAADAERWDAYDGRGARSLRALTAFCEFFLDTCLDQVRYMKRLLAIDELSRRVEAYANARAAGLLGTPLRPEARFLLREALLGGEVPRGDAARVTGLPERTARRVLGSLTSEGLLVSDGPKLPVRLGFPVAVLPHYFPDLYPPAALRDA